MLERWRISPRRMVDFWVMILLLSFSASLASRGRLEESWTRPSINPQSMKASNNIAIYTIIKTIHIYIPIPKKKKKKKKARKRNNNLKAKNKKREKDKKITKKEEKREMKRENDK